MFKNYLKIALRTLCKYKAYSLINILGLAIGMAACILILLWIQDELSYDRFHKNSDNLYRIFAEFTYSNESWAVTPLPLTPALKENFPEIADATRYRPYSALIEKDENQFNERGAFVDPSFLTMFTFPLLNGDAKTALTDPHSIVITEAMALKYFGEINPPGKTLEVDNKQYYKISAILKNIPKNSHFHFEYLLPFKNFLKKDAEPGNWARFQLSSYVLLQSDVPHKEVAAAMSRLLDKHNPEKDILLHLQPLTRIHLYNLNGGGQIEYVYIFSVIALFVLLIACINFINLTTARSSTRAKEIGVRKVAGALKSDLIKQFMGESIMLTVLTFYIAVNIVYLILPVFNNISGKTLKLDFFTNIYLTIGLLGILLFTGIISGIYPTLYLSAFKPVNILKGSFRPVNSKQRSTSFRKSLVVIQFSISIFLIISTIVISRQLHFVQNKNPGYDSEQVLYLPMKGNLKQQSESFKNEILQNQYVLHVAATSGMLVDMLSSYDGYDWEGKSPDKRTSIVLGAVDFDYIQTLKMEMAEGRNFSRKYKSDETSGFILNQTAIKEMGVMSPIGKRFSFEGRRGWRHGTIIGVVKDFHYQSLRSEIEPLVLIIEPDRFNYFCLRIKSDYARLSETIRFLKKTWQMFIPNYPFEYSFLDEEFESWYRTEQRLERIFSCFTFLAIFISCLGLLGLASFTVERRIKEIGVRKVLGASDTGIVRLITITFIKWVLLANIIAWPIAYYTMNKWLQNFAYKIEIGWWVFLLAGGLALIVALLTVSSQAIKAAMANPMESLRYE